MAAPRLGKVGPKTSPTKVLFELQGVPPNWLNWNRGLKERISMRGQWKEMTAWTAKNVRSIARWPFPTATEHREVAIRVYRVNQLDEDGLQASVKPIIDGLKYVQYVRIGSGGKHYVKVEGSGLIYDDGQQFITTSVKQFPAAHYRDEKTEIEVSRVIGQPGPSDHPVPA